MPSVKVASSIALITVNILVLISLRHSAANHGVDFIVSIPGSDNPKASVYVYMTSYNSEATVIVTWTEPNKPTSSGQAGIGGTGHQTIQFDPTSTPAAIRISASGPIVVVVSMVFLGHGVDSMGTYLVSPTDELSKTYVVAGHCGYESCNLIIANAYDAALVNVTLALTPDAANITFKGNTYYNGEVISLSLRYLEAVQINSVADLTGTTVASSQTIQVVSGSGFMMSSETANGNIMAEQMPSQSNLGTKFTLINSVSKSNVLTTVKVAFTQPNTHITFQGSELMLLLNTSRWAIYNFRKEFLTVLLTDKPVTVEMIFEVVKDAKITSLASVVVSPVGSWGSRYVIVMGVGSVFLVTTESCISNIIVDTSAISSQMWTQASVNAEYFGVDLTLTKYSITQVVIEGQMECVFGGYVTYTNGDGFTAFSLGWKKFEFQSSSPSFSDDKNTLDLNALTYHSLSSVSMEMVLSSQSLHLSNLNMEVTASPKSLTMSSSTVPLLSNSTASEDNLYSRTTVFAEAIIDTVSTESTYSPTASLYPASASYMDYSGEQSTASATTSVSTAGSNVLHCHHRCGYGINDGNHNPEQVTQFQVTSSSPLYGYSNPRSNISTTSATLIKPTNSTKAQPSGSSNTSKFSTLPSRLLTDKTPTTSFSQAITVLADSLSTTERLGSLDLYTSTASSVDTSIPSKIFQPSSVFPSQWIIVSKTTQLIPTTVSYTEITSRKSTNVVTTSSLLQTKANDIKTTQLITKSVPDTEITSRKSTNVVTTSSLLQTKANDIKTTQLITKSVPDTEITSRKSTNVVTTSSLLQTKANDIKTTQLITKSVPDTEITSRKATNVVTTSSLLQTKADNDIKTTQMITKSVPDREITRTATNVETTGSSLHTKADNEITTKQTTQLITKSVPVTELTTRKINITTTGSVLHTTADIDIKTTSLKYNSVSNKETTRKMTTSMVTTDSLLHTKDDTDIKTTQFIPRSFSDTARTTGKTSNVLTTDSLLHTRTDVHIKTTKFITKSVSDTQMTTRKATHLATTDSLVNTTAYSGIKTTETLVNNLANETLNFTISNTTSQCPCHCRSKFYLRFIANVTNLRLIMNAIEKDLLLRKKSLISYRMTKISFHNREQSAKYIGSTLGILVVVVIFGFLFSSDIIILCSKKSCTRHI